MDRQREPERSSAWTGSSDERDRSSSQPNRTETDVLLNQPCRPRPGDHHRSQKTLKRCATMPCSASSYRPPPIMAPSRLLSLFSTLSVVYSLPSPTFAATSSSPPSLTSCTSPNSTVSDPSVATLFGRAGNGTLVEYGRTNSGASIRTLCVRNSTGTVYLGGDFLSLSGLPSPYVASFDPGTGTFKSLGQGLDGPVYALSCDDDSGLWVAGAFDRPVGVQNGSSYGGNVAQWDYGTSGWKAPDFGGLDETVRDVQTAGTAQGSSVVFGGDFSVVYANPLSPGLAATNFASLGSALSPVPLNNGNASITASASSSTAGFSDIQNVLCPAGNDGAAGATWLAPDGQDNVSVTVGMGRAVTVGGIRLGNTHLNGAGVNTFQCAPSCPCCRLTGAHACDVTRTGSSRYRAIKSSV